MGVRNAFAELAFEPECFSYIVVTQRDGLQMVQEQETNKMRLDIERIKMEQLSGGQQQQQQATGGGDGVGINPALLQQIQVASVGIEGRLTEINAKVELLARTRSSHVADVDLARRGARRATRRA